MIIIPIGVDCRITFALRDNQMRTCSWPFDWVVTYNGVTDILKDNFANYLPKDKNLICNNTYFIHNTFPNDTETMQRRIQRFLYLLNTTKDEIIFFRSGHSIKHHKESLDFNVTLKNDLLDVEELHDYLKTKYPHLKFKIIVALTCGQCFNKETKYISQRENIYICNIATTNTEEEDRNFNQLFHHIFLR